MKKEEFSTYAENTWCPGCGNFSIESGFKEAVAELEKEGRLKRHNIVVLSGIGCHAKISDYLNFNSFYSLHGRVVAPATGVKLANPDLVVVGFAGDGDAYGEGLEHLVFAAKRNVDITMIIHNNRVYGLTTGQFTPTSPLGFRGRSTPKGAPEEPINPVELMLASRASFVAREFSGDVNNLKETMKQAMLHKGFAIIDVLQPCVTFFNTYQFYRERVYRLEDASHDPGDWKMAMEKALEWNYNSDGKIPLGIFYRERRKTFEDAVLRGKTLSELPEANIKALLSRHA